MKLMVIDGNSIVNRAFYGVRPLTTRDGTPTNAIYGFLTILFKLLDEETPDGLGVCFDLRAPTFRHLAYEGYKAQRKGMPEELAVQMPILKQVLDAMNVSRFELEGWEADDLLGTMAAKAEAAGWETVIVTGDKDSLQLISEHTTVKLVTSRMGQTTTRNMTPAVFQEEYGFAPIHMVDLKALMGDASDNIPGVPGVGEKTAMDLIQRYTSVDSLYAQFDTLDAKPGVLKKLDEGRAQAKLSYELATIRCDAPMEDFSPAGTKRRDPDGPALYELMLRLEFSKLIDKMGLTPGPTGGKAPTGGFAVICESEVVTHPARAEELLALWQQRPHISLLALPGLNGLCVEWGEPGMGRASLLFPDKLETYNAVLRRLFSSAISKVTHGAKTLMEDLLAEGLSLDGFVFDTELAAYLLDPTAGSYSLERLGMAYFGFEPPKAQEYLNPDSFTPLADPVPPLAALTSHTALIEILYVELKGRLEQFGLLELLADMELPLCPVLARMEQEGLLVDRAALARFGEMLRNHIEELQGVIYQHAGESFNINSTQQLGVILFDKLGLPPVKKNKTGYSTNAEVLEKLKGYHPIVDAILDYRQYAKLNSTYVEGLQKVIGPDGRIHTCFQNTVTATGRLSSTEPNLQNIPIRTELGAKMRDMFVARDGWALVDADYSQIELRILAHIANDATMIDAFRSGTDIHTVTASQVFAGGGEITSEMRRRAKAVNFGIVYGISDFSLAGDIGVSRGEAKEYMEKYFSTYSGVHAYQKTVVEQAKQDGYVTTLFGRRRWLPELASSNFNLRSFGERVALNMPIQGTAADVMKLAMIHVDEALLREGLEARLVLQVHDELLVECPLAEVETVKALLTREMESVAHLCVPLKADSQAGKHWGEAH